MVNNTLIRCRKCGKEKHVDFAYCLRNGWAMCCGETMVMINTKANIEDSVGRVIDSQVPHSKNIEKGGEQNYGEVPAL